MLLRDCDGKEGAGSFKYRFTQYKCRRALEGIFAFKKMYLLTLMSMQIVHNRNRGFIETETTKQGCY